MLALSGSRYRSGQTAQGRWVRVILLAAGLLLAAPAGADFIGHAGPVRTIDLSADGSRLLSGGFDYTVRLWEFGTQTEEAVLYGHDAPVNIVAFLPGGRRALTGGADGKLILWDLEAREALREIEAHRSQLITLAISRDGKLLATAGWDRTLALWTLEDLAPRARWRLRHNANALVFGVDEALYSGHQNGELLRRDKASGYVDAEFIGHGLPVTSLLATRDGQRLISAALDGTLWLWDIPQRRAVRHFVGHDGPVYRIVLSEDEATLVSVGSDGVLREWTVDSGALRREITAHDGAAWSVELTGDDRFALTAGSDASVRVWHRATGDRIGIPVADTGRPEPWLESDAPGPKMFRKCAACHALTTDEPHRSGPHLAGLFGRTAGSVEGYRYSSALERSDVVWDDETLRALFSEGPDVYLPGTKMPVQKISDPERLDALIAYLRVLTGPKRD
ncbi:MAG: c-type cytochrome [Gammaproteobacteria bacterium]|nr:c-type cytochrome [Gammaproteobacteria bacterium]